MELTQIPSQYASGSTVSWTQSFNDFPSSLWTLSYHLRGTAVINVTAVSNADLSYTVTLHATAAAGWYFWQAYVTNIADPTIKRMVDNGSVEVLADLSGVTAPYDGRSKAAVMVDAIDALLSKKATRDQASMTIGQRTLTRIPLDQLMTWRNYYARIVSNENMAARVRKGNSPFENVLVQFHRPGFDNDSSFDND